MRKHVLLKSILFAYRPVIKKKPKFLADMAEVVILSVAIPLIGSALSAMIVSFLGNEVSLCTLIVGIMAAFLGYALVNATQAYIERRHFYQHIEVRIDLFFPMLERKILGLSLEQYEKTKTRELEQKAERGIVENWTGVEGLFHRTSAFCINVLGLLLYAVIVGSIHPLILLLLAVLSFLSALIANGANKYERKMADDYAKENMVLHYLDRTVDQTAGGKDIRIFSLTPWLIGKYDRAIRRKRELMFPYDVWKFAGNLATSFFNAIRNLVCYLYLIYLFRQGLSVAEFVFYLGIVTGFSTWFQAIASEYVQLKQCCNEIGDFQEYLDLEEEPEGGLVPNNDFSQVEIEFDHVSYQYEGAKEAVLSDVSFIIRPGEHKALVGVNGAGKSTLVKLLAGLYLPTAGEVRINGISTRELSRKAYYAHEAVVFQEAFTLSYTIGENISLSEKWDEERVWRCLAEVGLEAKIRSLPAGLYTYLGKDVEADGIGLSGGETQKLLLARALYRNPSLVLLDEPTAAMDAIAESEIYETYSKTLRGLTALFISHRLASTRFCDEILLLSEGKIREQGTHEQLLEKRGSYYELFQIQSKYYEQMIQKQAAENKRKRNADSLREAVNEDGAE